MNPEILNCLSKTVVFCIRVSSDDIKQGHSLDHQQRKSELFTQEYNIKDYKLFSDEESGYKTERRKEFLKMVELCIAGKVSLIVLPYGDRFFRNLEDNIKYIKLLLIELKIPIYSMKSNQFLSYKTADEKLITHMTGSVNQFYRDSVYDHTHDELLDRAEQGNFLYPVPFGYKDKNQLKIDPITKKKKACELVINPLQADIVRGVYQEIKGKTFSYAKTSDKYNITVSVLKGIIRNLQRKVYHGYVYFNFDGELKFFKGKHQAILE
jgi:site-specific DNA recombinase